MFLPKGFIQALLLISVFHKRLTFMAAGHNSTCISTLICTAGGSSPQAFKEPFHALKTQKNKELLSHFLNACFKQIILKVIIRVKFFNENNLISQNQSGFKPGDSCTNQLLSITH